MTNEELKRTLWDAADKLRGSVAATQYKYPVPELVFLKYVRAGRSDRKAARYVGDDGVIRPSDLR